MALYPGCQYHNHDYQCSISLSNATCYCQCWEILGFIETFVEVAVRAGARVEFLEPSTTLPGVPWYRYASASSGYLLQRYARRKSDCQKEREIASSAPEQRKTFHEHLRGCLPVLKPAASRENREYGWLVQLRRAIFTRAGRFGQSFVDFG
eukprot:2982620-Rhodomonas_salina.1